MGRFHLKHAVRKLGHGIKKTVTHVTKEVGKTVVKNVVKKGIVAAGAAAGAGAILA